MPKKKGQQRQGRCVYCGAVGPVENEHVFAKVLFRVLDPQMITVPACSACNRKKSLGDRDLRNYITLHIAGSTHPDAMWHADQMVNSNVRTRLWIKKTIETAQKRDLVDEYGLVLSSALETDFNKSRFFESLKMSIRGLFFHHSSRMLPFDCPIAIKEVAWSDIFTFIEKYAAKVPGKISEKGKDVVWWKPYFSPDSPTESAWVLCFNDAVVFYATTGNAAITLQAQLDTSQAEEEVAESVRRILLPDGGPPIRIPRSSDGRLYIPD